MRQALIIALLSMTFTGSALAQTDDYVTATWVRKPTGEELSRALGRSKANDAVLQGVTIQVVLGCVVAEKGDLKDCKVLSETPPACHGGDAALRQVPYFRPAKTGADGQPLAGRKVRVPIIFVGGMAPPPDIAKVCAGH